MQLTQPANNSKNASDHQVEGRSWIYVQHVNLAFFGGGGGRPVHLRATRKLTGQYWSILLTNFG